MTPFNLTTFILGVTTLLVGASNSVWAQTEVGVFIPPAAEVVDGNKVDVLSGLNRAEAPVINIGAGAAMLSRGQSFYTTHAGGPADAYNQDSFYGRVCLSCTDSGSIQGYIFGPGFSKNSEGGGSLITEEGDSFSGPVTDPVSGAGISTYIAQDGTKYIYRHEASYDNPTGSPYNGGTLIKIVTPAGEITNINRYPEGRIESISNNFGYMLKYQYSSGGDLASITPVNLSSDYCPLISQSACPNQNYSRAYYFTLTYGTDNISVESNSVLQRATLDPLVRTYSMSIYKTTSPSGKYFQGNQNFQYYEYNQGCSDILDPICVLAGTFSKTTPFGVYSYTVSNYTKTCQFYTNGYGSGAYVDSTYSCDVHRIIVTNPLGGKKTYDSIINFDALFGKTVRVLTSVTDENNRVTNYVYVNQSTKIRRIVYPEGNMTVYSYDDRSNVTERRDVAKVGTGLADKVWTAKYDNPCNNQVTCNKPNYIIDPLGQRTDFTYDPIYGVRLTETAPSDTNGVRPQIRYQYTDLYAKIRDASGTLVNAADPVHKLTGVSTCVVATASNPASCVGTANENITTYTYNDNILLSSETVGNGDNTLSATTSYGYDYMGNGVWVDGPRTDVDDKVYKTYDAARRIVFEIGSDPDGSGPLKRAIIHHVYDVDDNETQTEVGTGNASDGSDFVISNFNRMIYDPAGRLIRSEKVLP